MAETTPKKIMRLDVTEEEMSYVIRSINLANSVVLGHWVEQIQDTMILRSFLDEINEPKRTDRLNKFRERIARLFVGDEMVDQALKDMESEGSAKGYPKCPECGGYHA